MIQRYRDHSANERTYLAWVRTAISIMAFGFLIEKFELFLASLSLVAGTAQSSFRGSPVAEVVGLSLFVLGAVMVISATWRFFLYKRLIDSDGDIPYGVRSTNLLLSGLIVLMAVFLAVYIARELF